MLIDLYDNEYGYARIFAEREGFGYELSTYRPLPIMDLFARMSGFPSAEAACAAAREQLASVRQIVEGKRKRSRQRVRAAASLPQAFS